MTSMRNLNVPLPASPEPPQDTTQSAGRSIAMHGYASAGCSGEWIHAQHVRSDGEDDLTGFA